MSKTKKTSLEQAVAQMKPAINEIAQLEILVLAFDKLDEGARFRVMKYFTDRFSEYVSSSNY